MTANDEQARRYSNVKRETWHSIDQISMPAIRDFARCWNELRHGKPAPTRADFDPAKLKPFLPNLFLLDVVRPEMRFRGRLVGTEISAALGFDYTGQFLDEVIPESYYPTLKQDLLDVVESGLLHYRITDMTWNNRSQARYHRLYAPLRRDTDRIDIVVGMACLIRHRDVLVTTEPMTAVIEGNVLQDARIVLAG